LKKLSNPHKPTAAVGRILRDAGVTLKNARGFYNLNRQHLARDVSAGDTTGCVRAMEFMHYFAYELACLHMAEREDAANAARLLPTTPA
jgi:hypothetical protein